MKLVKKLFCLTLISLPLLADAGNLNIANNTHFDISFRIDGNCSAKFGTVQRGTTKIIPENIYNQECSGYCDATVFMASNCGGLDIAKIGFGPYGIFYIDVLTPDYYMDVAGNEFNLSFTTKIKQAAPTNFAPFSW